MALAKSIKFVGIEPVFASDGSLDFLRLRVQVRVDEDGVLLIAKEFKRKAVLTAQQKTALANFLTNLILTEDE